MHNRDRTTPLGGRARGMRSSSQRRGAARRPDAGRRRGPAGHHASRAPASRCCKLAVPRAEGDSGAAAVETMSKDMDITGLFQVLDPASFPAQLQSEGLAFSSALWTQVGAQAVIKMKASGGALEGKVYVVARGDSADAVQELPQRRHPRRRPRVRQRHRAVVHRQARRVRLAHRVRDERPRLARDRAPSTWTAGAWRC